MKYSAKKVRAHILREPENMKRDPKYIDRYQSEGYAMDAHYINNHLTILKTYEQEK